MTFLLGGRPARGRSHGVARRRCLGPAAAVVVVLAGCTASSTTVASPGASPSETAASGPAATAPGSTGQPDADAVTAATLCGWLVTADSRLGDVANDAVAGISAATPAARHRAIMAGYDAAIRVAEDLPAQLDDLDLPDVPERQRLVAEVDAGAGAAVAELSDEREVFAARDPAVADEDVFGIVGQFFNGFEKAMSALEPDLSRDARPELQAAFLGEESCQFVVQPFTLDD